MKKFEHMGGYISYLYRMSQCYVNKKLEPYHIGSGQFHYLLILYKKDGISQEYLSEEFKIDKATTGRAIKKLVEEGYVNRIRDPEDKRSYKIYLTQKGHSIKLVIMKVLKEWNDLLLEDIDEEEKQAGILVLQKMFKNIGSYNGHWDHKRT